MTSETTKKNLYRLFDEIVNQGKLEVADELFAPDFVSHGPEGDIKGIDAFKNYVRAWRTGIPDVRCEVLDLIVEGDVLAWRIRATGTHTGEMFGLPPTGSALDFLSLNHAYVRDGKFVEHWMLMDQRTLMAQLGGNA
jgi:predicted ester cyclase